MVRDCAPIPWRLVRHANIATNNNSDYNDYDDDEDDIDNHTDAQINSINPRQGQAGCNPGHGNEEMRASKEKSGRLSAAEKEKTKLRERQRRAITSRILGGLRKYGGYNLPPRADINQVLKALANEAGWVVESDGTTYRAQAIPPQSEGSQGVRQTIGSGAKGSATGGAAVYGGMPYEGECSTTVSPIRRQPDSNSSSLSLLQSSLSAPFAETDNNAVMNSPCGLMSPGFLSCSPLPQPPSGESIAEPPGSGGPFYATGGALDDLREMNIGRMLNSLGEMSGGVLNSASRLSGARFLPPLTISPLLVFPRHNPNLVRQRQEECRASNGNTPVASPRPRC